MVSTFGFSSVAQLCPILCDPMNRNTPGLPVHHQLLEFAQTHIHSVSDANQEMWVQSLGQKDPLEKEMVTHSSILAWEIPWMEEPGRL